MNGKRSSYFGTGPFIYRLALADRALTDKSHFFLGSIRFVFAAEFLQPLSDHRFVATIGRLVIAAFLRKILLIDPTAFEVMAVLVAGMSQLLGARVVGIAKVNRHR